MRKGHKPAGGIASKNVTHKPVKTGVGARAVNKNWPASVGGSRGNRVGGLEGGAGKILKGIRPRPYDAGPSFNPVKQGNELAAATKCGPGGSREVFKSGSQHGLTTRANNPRGRSFDD